MRSLPAAAIIDSLLTVRVRSSTRSCVRMPKAEAASPAGRPQPMPVHRDEHGQRVEAVPFGGRRPSGSPVEQPSETPLELSVCEPIEPVAQPGTVPVDGPQQQPATVASELGAGGPQRRMMLGEVGAESGLDATFVPVRRESDGLPPSVHAADAVEGLVQSAVPGVAEPVTRRPFDGMNLVEEIGELGSDPRFGPRRTHDTRV